jgi:hypothetical protein
VAARILDLLFHYRMLKGKTRVGLASGTNSKSYNNPGTKDHLLQAMLQYNVPVFICEYIESATKLATQKEKFWLASLKHFHKN